MNQVLSDNKEQKEMQGQVNERNLRVQMKPKPV